MNRQVVIAIILAALIALATAPHVGADGDTGYPPPPTETSTMPPMTWPACTPHCPTNTPVPDDVIVPALTPVIGDAVTWPPAVAWLPMLAKAAR